MTTKRDMLLTLVFLRLICSRFNEQKEKIKSDVLTNLGKAEDALSAEERPVIGALANEVRSTLENEIDGTKNYNISVKKRQLFR